MVKNTPPNLKMTLKKIRWAAITGQGGVQVALLCFSKKIFQMVHIGLNAPIKRVVVERITSNGIKQKVVYESDNQRVHLDHLYTSKREQKEIKIIHSSMKKYTKKNGVETITGEAKENFLKKVEIDFPILHLR